MADDHLLPSIVGKFFFVVDAVFVLDQKVVIPEQRTNFLWKKLQHFERKHRFLVTPLAPKKPLNMIDL